MAKRALSSTAKNLIEQLRAAAKATGEKKYERAAVLLEAPGKAKGRREIDDSAAIHKMAELLKEGKAKTRWEAAEQVAHETPGQSIASTVKRLNRKFRSRISPAPQPKPAAPAPEAQIQYLFETVENTFYPGRSALGTGMAGYSLWARMFSARDLELILEARRHVEEWKARIADDMQRSGLHAKLAELRKPANNPAFAKMRAEFEEARRAFAISPELSPFFKLADNRKTRL